MSDNTKKEKEKTITYSEAFEEFEKKRHSDQGSNLFFKLLDSMQEEYREEQAESYRTLFQAVDIIGKTLSKASETEEGRAAIQREIKKRLNTNVK